MALKVVNTVYNIFFNNSTKKMWKKIRWDKSNRLKKVKVHIFSKYLSKRKIFKVYLLFYLINSKW